MSSSSSRSWDATEDGAGPGLDDGEPDGQRPVPADRLAQERAVRQAEGLAHDPHGLLDETAARLLILARDDNGGGASLGRRATPETPWAAERQRTFRRGTRRSTFDAVYGDVHCRRAGRPWSGWGNSVKADARRANSVCCTVSSDSVSRSSPARPARWWSGKK